ncbi:TIGR00341 family protein [Rubrivirga sp. IMCC43871]|uniref:TIGR00341 family protein n=1 Tax=Rubrivirga sp. IMCC43871 TaxID=3391575 RepID=UPI00398FB37A
MPSDSFSDRATGVSRDEAESAAEDAQQAASAAETARAEAETARDDAETAADSAQQSVEKEADGPPPPADEAEDFSEAAADPVLDNAPDADADSAVEEIARRQFGIRTWERPALYRETAEAATDTDVPFFAVLLLSGAIATLGLVLDSTAVVIGAMLVAPLLGPLLGLSLALAVGDGRLFVQTAAAVLLGAAGIVGLAALLTLLLPFQTVTAEIASRTRPTTLDLAIAVFSGLAGAVVTASREARLSASIPGVAVAVALVPPLGVAGFGIAIGEWAFTRGALLLFGANLAGIVLSGMGVFFLIGMHRTDVVEAARAWHDEGQATGVAARVSGMRWLDRLPGMATPLGRFVLVVAFMAAVAVPLTTSLGQFVREARINAAVDAAESELEKSGRAFVIERDLTLGDTTTTVRLRVATSEWIRDDAEAELTAMLATAAEEPVTLTVEQVLASTGDLASFADALPSSPTRATADPRPVPIPVTLSEVRGRLAQSLRGLALPDGVRLVGGEVRIETEGGPPALEVAYAATRRLPPQAEELLARQAARTLGLDEASARTRAVVLGTRAIPDSAGTAALAAIVADYPRVRLTLAGDTAAVRAARARVVGMGAPADRVRARPDTLAPRASLSLAPDSLATD